MIAFHGEAETKAGLLDQIARRQALPLTTYPGVDQAQHLDWAARVGLPAALVMLTGYLSPEASSSDEARSAFAHDLLAGIPPGAALDGAAHGFTALAWDRVPSPLIALVTEPSLAEAARDLIDLHSRAGAGAPVERSAWRAERSRLNRLAGAGGDEPSPAATLAASAWDYVAMPGAAWDFARTWDALILARTEAAHGWGTAERDRLEAMLADIRPELLDRVGPRPDKSDVGALQSYLARFKSTMGALIQAHADRIWDQHKALQIKINDARRQLKAELRPTLIAVVSGAPQHLLTSVT